MVTSRHLSVFRCPIESACDAAYLTHALKLTQMQEGGISTQQPTPSCTQGADGLLCSSCNHGWGHGRQGPCIECEPANLAWWSVGALSLCLVAAAYVAWHKYSSAQRMQDCENKPSAALLFRFIAHQVSQASSAPPADELDRDVLLAQIKQLGLRADHALLVVDSIDIDHDGNIEEDEFVAWMQLNFSRSSVLGNVVTILIGFLQVLKAAPQQLQALDVLPKEWELLSIFSLDLNLLVPCVPSTHYYTGFFAKVIVMPAALMSLVTVTWLVDSHLELAKARKTKGDAFDLRVYERERRAWATPKQHGDLYFAFFLAYPSITESLLKHFHCRRLSPTLAVLHADYSVECYTWFGAWFACAVFAACGILFVSFGVPVYYWYKMREAFNWQMNLIHLPLESLAHQSRIQAYCRFRDQFDFIAGGYKPECYSAEPIDLIRKLILGGLIMFVEPGTVAQNFISMVLSGAFLLIHARQYAYPFDGCNLLKLLCECQILIVISICLILRMDSGTLDAEGFGKSDYHILMVGLLAITMLPAGLLLVREQPAHTAQQALLKWAHAHKEKFLDVANEEEHVEANPVTARPTGIAMRQALPPITAAQIFEQLGDGNAHTTFRQLRDWWAQRQPEEVDIDRVVRMQDFVSSLDQDLDEPLSQGQKDVESILGAVLKTEFRGENDSSTGRDYYVHVMTRAASWSLPSVDAWLVELCSSTPPRLVQPEKRALLRRASAAGTGLDIGFQQSSIDDQQQAQIPNVNRASRRPGESAAASTGPIQRPATNKRQRGQTAAAPARPAPIAAHQASAREEVTANPLHNANRIEAELRADPVKSAHAVRTSLFGPGVEPTADFFKLFRAVDSNNNGRVSITELNTWLTKEQQRFRALGLPNPLITLAEIPLFQGLSQKSEDASLDQEDFCLLLSALKDFEWEEQLDPATRRVFYRHKRSKCTQWAKPSLNEWIEAHMVDYATEL